MPNCARFLNGTRLNAYRNPKLHLNLNKHRHKMFSCQLLSFSCEILFKLTRLYHYLSIWGKLTQKGEKFLKTQNEIKQKTTGYW